MRPFLKTNFHKGQFIPCGEDGKVLDKQPYIHAHPDTLMQFERDKVKAWKKQYQKAQEAVIFVGVNHEPYFPRIEDAYHYLTSNRYTNPNEALNAGVQLLIKIKG